MSRSDQLPDKPPGIHGLYRLPNGDVVLREYYSASVQAWVPGHGFSNELLLGEFNSEASARDACAVYITSNSGPLQHYFSVTGPHYVLAYQPYVEGDTLFI